MRSTALSLGVHGKVAARAPATVIAAYEERGFAGVQGYDRSCWSILIIVIVACRSTFSEVFVPVNVTCIADATACKFRF